MTILFIGNSFSYVQDGIDQHLNRLILSSTSGKEIKTGRHTQDGATLKVHYSERKSIEAIQSTQYDYIILQDDLPEYDDGQAHDDFLRYARLFNAEIIASGSQAIFFMAWPYKRLPKTNLDTIEKAHREACKMLNVKIAPVGRAFVMSQQLRPTLPMLGFDKEHQSIYGAYLAACVVYATLYNESPVGIKYSPKRMSSDEAMFLQENAWECLQCWQKEM